MLKTIWDFFDMALLFSQTGISKHSGLPAWLMAFAYICGLINNVKSANKNASFSADAPFLRHLLGQKVSQSALSRFLAKPFAWLQFSLGRVARLQEKEESRLIEGDVIALDDTKIEHRHGKKIPFLCWLFDSSDKRHLWCMNLVSTFAVLNNGLEYPLLWRFWVKTENIKEKQTKLELAKKMLTAFRSLNDARVWVAMDRWFLCKKFLRWLMDNDFDWVTKAKRNTVLFRKTYDHRLGKKIFVKLNPQTLLREAYPKLRKDGSAMSIADIYIKIPYETVTKKEKPITRQEMVPVAAIAATYTKQASDIFLPEAESPATFKDAYLLLSNRVDKPKDVAIAYAKRWRIEVFYRMAKQNLGLTSCYARSETAHFAHVELLFTANTLLCYATWHCKEEGVEEALPPCEVVGYFFNAGCRIYCGKQQIQVYFDITTRRFASLIKKFWPKFLELKLWNWNYYPGTA